MFRPFELGTVLIKASLGHASVSYMEPYVVTLVLCANSFTKFRVCLNKPSIVLVSLNLLDPSPTLTLEILLNEILENVRVCKYFPFNNLVFGPNSKEFENFGTRFLGKLTTVDRTPRDVGVTCRFLV
jgi:hypothetical protein